MKKDVKIRRYILPATVIVLLVCFGGGLWEILDFFRPLPPARVTMVTGPPGGAYHAYGERYREFFAREGVELQLLPTAGALDNLARLNDPQSGATVGFVQGGLTSEAVAPNLQSLGTLFYEPLWFFCRDSSLEQGLDGLKGRRIAIGPEGSGTHAVALELLGKNGITPEVAKLLPLSFEDGRRELLSGGIDAMLIVASWQSPVVRELITAEHIDLMGFPHVDAYVALYPYLSKMVVPAGVGDMVRDRPPTDRLLLAAKASLVLRSEVHPAIQYLLLEAATKIHSGAGLFHRAGQFPAADSIELPLSDEARRYYRNGEPFLQRYLPFWLAVMLGRLVVIVLPLIGLLYPLIRFLPVLFDWKMRRRILLLYKELQSIEKAWESRGEDFDIEALSARLNQLERKADQLWLPTSTMDTLYLFKEHVGLVRERLDPSPR